MEKDNQLPAEGTTFDFIIVGGGTSGLVVASRLSENPKHSILVLEAGHNQLENEMINTPAMWTAILGSPDVDWAFLTTPQEHLYGRVCRQPQGKALGGSSALNAELFIAPSKLDIDTWGKLGNPGWDWETLRPYYRKCHTLNLPSAEAQRHLGLDWSDGHVRGSSGPIQASFPVGTEDPLPRAWVETSQGLGLPLNRDPFSGESCGFYSNACSIDSVSKRRSYAAPAYFVPAKARPNMIVLTGAMVQKIILEGCENGVVATGVMVEVDGQPKHFRAGKEVILAAGAFQSPKILELSGVGRKDLLQSLNIPVIIDNPNVGENLQDHLLSGICFEAADGVPTLDGLMRQEPEVVQKATTSYTEHQAGPLGYGCFASHAFLPVTDALQPGGKEELARLFSARSPTEQEDPTFQMVRSIVTNPDLASACAIGFSAQVNLHDDKGERGGKNYVQMPGPGNFLSLGLVHCHPLSRGSVHITAADAKADPGIDMGYLSHPLDVEVFARHLLSLQTLVEQHPLATLVKPGGRRNHPSAHFQTLDEAREYLRRTVISNNHPSCTCPMLPREKGGVVNDKLLVHGTENLRIVDSSIMPLIPQANIQSTVYAVAERAADLIGERYG